MVGERNIKVGAVLTYQTRGRTTEGSTDSGGGEKKR
jgi:hypothetical protein